MQRAFRAVDRNVTVLIVEDEPLVRAMAADIFMEAGYRVLEACHAADALTILEGRDDIEAVFTDIEMPGPGDVNGLDLASAIRDRWPEITVLITSGRVHPGLDQLPTGTDFIPKPYRPREVIKRLGTIGPLDHSS